MTFVLKSGAGQLTFGRKGIKIWWGDFSRCGEKGQIFDWWRGLPLVPLSRENQQSRGVEDMEFPEVLKNWQVYFPEG